MLWRPKVVRLRVELTMVEIVGWLTLQTWGTV